MNEFHLTQMSSPSLRTQWLPQEQVVTKYQSFWNHYSPFLLPDSMKPGSFNRRLTAIPPTVGLLASRIISHNKPLVFTSYPDSGILSQQQKTDYDTIVTNDHNLAGNPFPCLLLILGITAVLGLWLLSPSPNPVDSKKVKRFSYCTSFTIPTSLFQS